MDFNLAGVSAFAFMACLLLLGVVLRARLRFIQNLLIPASLLGGLIGFIMMNAGITFGFDAGDFTAFAFHFFTISFMSLCLTGSDGPTAQAERAGLFGGSMWMAVVWTISFALQGLIGLILILSLNGVNLTAISPYLGIIVSAGFTQGPGQALAVGSLWESSFAITDAIQIGVIFASLGFLVTFAIGVPVARLILRDATNEIDRDVLTGLITPEHRQLASRHVTHPSNVETMAYHIGLLGLVYMVTYQYMLFMRDLTADVMLGSMQVSVFFTDSLLFVHGLVIAILTRLVIEKFGWSRHLDASSQKVITGTSVDFMIVGTLLSIQFSVLSDYLLPIVVVTTIVTLGTLALCFGFTDRRDPDGLKRSLTIFGCCCGSSGTGLLLLRLVDPHFETPIAKELAVFNILIIFTSAPLTMIMMPTLPAFGLAMTVAVFGATILVGALYMTVALRKRRRLLHIK